MLSRSMSTSMMCAFVGSLRRHVYAVKQYDQGVWCGHAGSMIYIYETGGI
jgi:hypothetical protein